MMGDEECIELPPGFRFHPTDEEIITHYLLQKFLNPSFTSIAVADVDLNKCEPWDLPGKAKMGEKEWYFFCDKDRKYPTGTRTNRATAAGYWKATGKDKEIYRSSWSSSSGCRRRSRGLHQQQQHQQLVGMKKTLVFYHGRAPKGVKTNWIMHEYRLVHHHDSTMVRPSSSKECVVCRVFHKSTGLRISSTAGTDDVGEDDSVSLNALPPLTDNLAARTAARSLNCSWEHVDGSMHVSSSSDDPTAPSAAYFPTPVRDADFCIPACTDPAAPLYGYYSGDYSDHPYNLLPGLAGNLGQPYFPSATACKTEQYSEFSYQ